MDDTQSQSAGIGFRYRLRVRYGECDAQGVVFNARYGDYIDIAVCEFLRLVWGGMRELLEAGIDYQLVKQTVEWKSGARMDEVLSISVQPGRIGTTSFVIGTRFHSLDDDRLIAAAETTYVLVDAKTLRKIPI